MGYELAELVGKDEDAVAAKLISAMKDETAKSVKGDVNAHQKVWNAKPEDGRCRSALLHGQC
jgi:hypothetical protein